MNPDSCSNLQLAAILSVSLWEEGSSKAWRRRMKSFEPGSLAQQPEATYLSSLSRSPYLENGDTVSCSSNWFTAYEPQKRLNEKGLYTF